uniref:Uncharacterized protein n=1 Tax=Anguilla anguilla TaxID=7936 RepID=A0A0E9TRX0_ANGAN
MFLQRHFTFDFVNWICQMFWIFCPSISMAT